MFSIYIGYLIQAFIKQNFKNTHTHPHTKEKKHHKLNLAQPGGSGSTLDCIRVKFDQRFMFQSMTQLSFFKPADGKILGYHKSDYSMPNIHYLELFIASILKRDKDDRQIHMIAYQVILVTICKLVTTHLDDIHCEELCHRIVNASKLD